MPRSRTNFHARRTTRTYCRRCVYRGGSLRNRRRATLALELGDGALLTEWKSAYGRGLVMQAPIALVGSLLGLLACWQTNDWRWLFGAMVLVANWPYTLFAIMPTNRQLKAIDPASAGPTSRTLIERWSRLHAVRSALGFAGTLIFLWASMS